MEKRLFENLFINDNPVEILDFLADKLIKPNSFNENWVISHFEEMDLYLMLFIKRNGKDEFLSFRFSNFSEYPDSMLYLNGVLLDLAKSDYKTYKPLQQKLEDMIHMRPVYQAYFQAKNKNKVQ